MTSTTGADPGLGVQPPQGFGRLLGVRLLGQAGDGIFQASLAGAVLFNPERQARAADIAAGFAVLLLPYSLVGPFAGVLLDRWRRQRVLLLANGVRAGLVVLTAVVLASGRAGVPLYACALAAVSVNRFILSALSAALPHTVARARLASANSLSTTSGTGAAVLGGGLALLLRAPLGEGDTGYAAVAGLAAAVYLGAGAAALLLGPESLGPELRARAADLGAALRSVAAGLVSGARHVAQRRPAIAALSAIAAHRFWYGISTIATLLLYRNYFTDQGLLRAGLPGLGQAFAASAVGYLLAALLTPVALRRLGSVRWLVGLFALAAVTEIALGLPYEMGPLLAAALLLGVVAQGSKIAVDTLLQQTIDDAYRGRVFSFYDTLFNLTFVSAAVFSALVLPDSGKSYLALGVIAGGYAVTAIGYGLASRTAGPRASVS